MLFFIGLLLALALGVSGCVDCTTAGCSDEVEFDLVPEISTTYDVTVVLDGEAGAFTCKFDGTWSVRDAVGSAASLDWECTGMGFWLEATPDSVEITVNAQDASWSGSASMSLTYPTFKPNGPGCPPTCRVAQLTITNDLGAFEVQP